MNASRTLPSELIVLKPGRNAVEGHADVILDDAAGWTIMANHYKNRGGAARPIDVDHATIRPSARGADGLAPAVGWIEALRFDPKRGVVAQVTFNTAGRAHLAAGRYRAFSPTILLDGGRPVELHSIALTNQPRMGGTSLLAASHGAGASIPLCDGRMLVCCSGVDLDADGAQDAPQSDPFLVEGERIKCEKGCSIGDAYSIVARAQPKLYAAYKANLIAQAGAPGPRHEAASEAPDSGRHPYLLKAAEIKAARGLDWSSAYSATCREFPGLYASYTGRA